jgi:hypothetical protein
LNDRIGSYEYAIEQGAITDLIAVNGLKKERNELRAEADVPDAETVAMRKAMAGRKKEEEKKNSDSAPHDSGDRASGQREKPNSALKNRRN